jgi:hypothetical protein
MCKRKSKDELSRPLLLNWLEISAYTVYRPPGRVFVPQLRAAATWRDYRPQRTSETDVRHRFA